MAKKKKAEVTDQDLIKDLDALALEFNELIKQEKNMATAKSVNRLGDKLSKVNESFTVNMYDNGFMVEAGGRNKKGEYVNAKILCNTLDEVLALVKEAGEMDRDV